MRLDTARSWRSAIARISTAHLRNEQVQMLAHVLPVIEKRYISIPGNRCAAAHLYSTRRVSPMSEWQPMSTAPRDGTVVDLWHKDGLRITEVWWVEEDRCWSDTREDDEFTHWMPMPDPPTQASIESAQE